MSYDLRRDLTESARAVAGQLARLLPPVADQPERRLFESMRYATLGSGKRVRPFLVMKSAALFNVSPQSAMRTACAVEMLHSYSLIHDDLPAMDDDDLRRGQPACHKQFDEATAILAGDALLTFAFDVLAQGDTHSDPQVRLKLVAALSRAAGPYGMVGGQMMDLEAEHQPLSEEEVTRLHIMKTGRIFSFCCEAGALLGKAPQSNRLALQAYAHDLGLAFQIHDDVLDVEGSAEVLGKSAGKDEAQGKATWVKILSLEDAKNRALMLAEQSIQHLSVFDGAKAEPLAALARYVVRREK